MAAYVIKSWHVEDTPMDAHGTLVHIVGRAPGLLAWMLSLLKIDPTIDLRITEENVIFSEGSLRGNSHRCIPIRNISSISYGYTKPWREALVIAILLSSFFGIGIILGIIYYVLNKSLNLGIVELGSVASGIDFKRSVIEGVNVDEEAAQRVAGILQARVDAQR